MGKLKCIYTWLYQQFNWNDERGYILEVDLEYPKEIHDYHNSYPLCPERKLIKTSMLSKFQLHLKDKLNISSDHVEKLICDLTDKTHYKVHYRNLQLYLQLGMILKCVHRVLSYAQREWLKDYIVGNSTLRADTKKRKYAFGANLYKIKNNSVFGKQMENVRNRVDIVLIKNKKQDADDESYSCVDNYIKLCSHPTYKHTTIFNENLVAVHRNKKLYH